MAGSPRSGRRSDASIEAGVCRRLARGEVDARDIDVTVVAGEVVLQGSVGSRRAKRIVGDVAVAVPGVRHVPNRLGVRRGELEHPDGGAPWPEVGVGEGSARPVPADRITDASRPDGAQPRRAMRSRPAWSRDPSPTPTSGRGGSRRRLSVSAAGRPRRRRRRVARHRRRSARHSLVPCGGSHRGRRLVSGRRRLPRAASSR